MVGVDVLVVDFSGKGRLSPQSPCDKEEEVVCIACIVGKGWVAVSEVKSAVSLKSILGLGIGGGREKRREFRNKLAVGDSLFEDINVSLARSLLELV